MCQSVVGWVRERPEWWAGQRVSRCMTYLKVPDQHNPAVQKHQDLKICFQWNISAHTSVDIRQRPAMPLTGLQKTCCMSRSTYNMSALPSQSLQICQIWHHTVSPGESIWGRLAKTALDSCTLADSEHSLGPVCFSLKPEAWSDHNMSVKPDSLCPEPPTNKNTGHTHTHTHLETHTYTQTLTV